MSQLKVNSVVDASGGSGAILYGVASPPNSMGFRNRIINGALGIWQRGTGPFSTFNAYSADRWGIQNVTSVTQSSDTPSAGFPFSIEFANSSASFPLVLQRIESANARDLVGQQVTLSFWAKNVSGSAILYCELYYPSASDNFGSITLIQSITASASPSSSWTFYTLTFNALPSQVANGLEVRIVRNNGSAATTRATGVQLEAGTVASPFERRDYGRELIMCQRYFELISGFEGSTVPSGQVGRLVYTFKVTKRAAPTVTLGASANGAVAAAAVDGCQLNVITAGAGPYFGSPGATASAEL